MGLLQHRPEPAAQVEAMDEAELCADEQDVVREVGGGGRSVREGQPHVAAGFAGGEVDLEVASGVTRREAVHRVGVVREPPHGVVRRGEPPLLAAPGARPPDHGATLVPGARRGRLRASVRRDTVRPK